MPLRRILIWLLPVAALGLAGLWLLQPKPVAVETGAVTEGRFVATVAADGRTRVRERYLVSAPVAGRIERIRLKPGDRVERDTRLAVLRAAVPALLDPRARAELEERLGAAEAQVEEAEAMVARARLARETAVSDLERTRQLLARGAASAVALERDLATVALAGRDLVAAERRAHAAAHQKAQAAAALMRSAEPGSTDMIALTSPIQGVVLRVAIENETAIQAGAAVLELGDLSDLEIVADPLTIDAVQMRPGAPVIIERWGGPADLQGTLRRVEPGGFTKVSALGVEEQRTNVIIDLISPVPMREGLGDNYRVEVRITVAETERATLVPTGALFRRAGGWHVFALVEGRARLRPVELLRRSGDIAALKGGLMPGMAVIVFPPNALADGALVQVLPPGGGG